MKKPILFLIIILVAIPCAGNAFDGERLGFILNLGAGMGQGRYDNRGYSLDDVGFTTNIKIGPGLGGHVFVYLSNQSLWYNPSEYWGTRTNILTSFGATYFLNRTAPSFYFSGSVGVSVLGEITFNNLASGPGASLGMGYEFIKNLALEFSAFGGKVDWGYNGDPFISSLTLTVHWLAY